MIEWVGNTNLWQLPQTQYPSKYLMALSEESVLDVAFSNSDLFKIHPNTAIATVSRLALRVALSSTNLNPTWQPITISPGIVKSSTSHKGSGVSFVWDSEYLDKLNFYAPELSNIGVWEEIVVGKDIEINGAVINNNLYLFHPLESCWSIEESKLIHNRLTNLPDGCYLAISRVLNAIPINNSAFCLEFKVTHNHEWKLLNFHARLSSKLAAKELICNSNPLEQIQTWAITNEKNYYFQLNKQATARINK